MILSRTIGKRRIEQGVRPSWGAAWVLVAFDAACLVFVAVLAYRPFQSMVVANDWPVWAIALALLLIGFLPLQAVLIVSSLWASKSRWIERETE